MTSYHCSKCNKYFVRKDIYNKHLLTTLHNKESSLYESGLKCNCGKTYSHVQSLNRHKRTCKKLNTCLDIQDKLESLEKENDDIRKEYKIMEQEREFLRKQVEDLYDKFEQLNPTPVVQPLVQNNNTTNTTNNNNCIENQTNNNLHVHINSFGNENLDYITNDFIHGCVNRIYESVPTIVEKMHFDPAHPENHNFKIPNKKLPHASVMSEDQKWKLMDRQEAINNMIDKGYNIIDSQFREDPSKFSESKRRHYRRFQENYDTEDKDTMKRIRSDVELVVLNGTREIHNKPAALKGST